MPEMPDYDLVKTEGDPPPPEPAPEGPPIGVRIAALVLVVAVGVALYFAFGGRMPVPPAVETTVPPAIVEEPVQPLGLEPDPIIVPPLDESDPLIRELVKQLSSHPRVAAWLATNGLIRNFTVVTSNIAEGVTPAGHLPVLRPSGTFRTIERGGSLFIDPASYQRYDSLTDAVAAVDPKGIASLYATLRPRIQEAHGELGFPDTPFDRTLERAIVLLLNTPVIDDPIAVEPMGIGYGFANERLEGLADAQKQLLRFGPRNVRLIQRALRDIAGALGIPAARLPEPRASSFPTGPAAWLG
jgi:hypothetical protein